MNEGTFRAMGSDVKWSGGADCGARLERWFEEVESCCSRFRDDSELSRLNRNPAGEVTVSPLLRRVLAAAQQAHELSGGHVDPTILDALEAAGYDRDLPFARRAPLPPPTASRDWTDVVLLDRSIRRPPGLRIDLGGIAKSWTAWNALDLLEGPCFVDAAGDIALRGPWVVGVEHDGDVVTALAVDGGGVATSGTDRRRWTGGHHIIDPATRAPAKTDVVAATVIADDTPTAETVARTIVLLGAWHGLGWAESVTSVRGALASTTRGVTLALPSTKEVLA